MDFTSDSFESTKFLSHYPAELSEKVFMTVEEGIMITDDTKRIVHVNPAFELVTGYKRIEVVGQSPRILQSGVHQLYFYKDMWKIIEEEGEWSGEIWNRRKNGEIYPEWLHIMEIRDDANTVTNYCGIFIDLSDHEGVLKQLKDVALTDPLTKLGNRQFFIERMNDLLNISYDREFVHAVLYLDLDRFKQINDTLGHSIGDEMLKEFARRLRKVLKNKDILSRIGGDEFVITLTGLKHARDAEKIAKRILEKLESPHIIGTHELFLSTSIGISFFPHDGKTLEELLKKADLAMYESKRNGRNNYSFFYDELEEDMTRIIQLEIDLLKAIEQKNFIIHYQPKINMKKAEVEGIVAIVKCDLCQEGLMELEELVPIIEDLGLINKISEIIIEKISIDILSLINDGVEFGSVAVAIPSFYFSQSNFIESILDILETNNVSPHYFELELTERAIMDDGERSISKLNKLKSLGFKLTVNRFGSGYTSFSYLPKYPLDFLKIDAHFIRNIFEAEENRIIVDMIIQLAHRLGIEVIADGVDDAIQMRLVKDMDCDLFQGFFSSEEMAIEKLGNFIEMFDAMGLELDING